MNRVIVPARQATQAGGIDSLESIPGLHKRLQIWPLVISFFPLLFSKRNRKGGTKDRPGCVHVFKFLLDCSVQIVK
jgi:hypothetical protein